jgi:membrane protease YdiL (CAAX protease family)
MLRRHPVVAFTIAACLYSWTLWFLMIASARNWLPFRFPTNFTGSFGPLLAALVLARWAGLASGPSAFMRTTLGARLRPRWILGTLLGPPLVVAAAVSTHAFAKGALQRLQGLDRAALLPFVFLLILIAGGPVGEEFGWRGYALAILLRRRAPVVASLIVAASWFLWHLPLFWLEGAAQQGSSIPAFALTVVAASVVFTWVYLHTAPALVPVLLLHTSINVSTFVLPTILPGVDESRVFNIAFVALSVLLAVVIIVADPAMRKARARPA